LERSKKGGHDGQKRISHPDRGEATGSVTLDKKLLGQGYETLEGWRECLKVLSSL